MNMIDQDTEKRILVIEKQKFWVDLLKLQLESGQIDIEITHAEDGEKAIKHIKESQSFLGNSDNDTRKKYDAIIIEMEMPIMDGRTTVRAIRDLLYTGPIIVWSAHRNSSENLKKALDVPVSGFCTKESSLQSLLEHLKNLNVID